MPKQVRIAYARLNNYEDLDNTLMELRDAGKLSISQYSVSKSMLCKYVPTMIKVYQRMPKSVTYFDVKGNTRVKLTNRAKIYTADSSVQSSVVGSVVEIDGEA